MASNLIDLFNNTVGDLLARQASSILGESAANTSTGLSVIVPKLFGVLAQKANTDTGATDLTNYMTENNIDGSLLTNVSGMLGGGIETERLMYNGAGMVRYLFDDKLTSVVDSIASASGLKTSSATSLLKLAAPLVLGIVGKHIREKGLDAAGLKTLLVGQQDFIKVGISANVGKMSGVSAATPSVPPTVPPTLKMPSDVKPQNQLSSILPWLVLGLASLGLFYFIQNGCGASTPPEPESVVIDAIKDTVITEAPREEPANPLKNYNLPGGGTIKLIPGSFTANLAEFLESQDDGEKCLLLDRVYFEDGSFQIAAGSDVQLLQLSILLKAYPEARSTITVYTDNAGDAGKNKTLSKERAKVIKEWLVGKGIAPGKVDTKGMGAEDPIASNRTEQGRERNRRIELCVAKK
jgi:OOP family OmpA-OmpF porin